MRHYFGYDIDGNLRSYESYGPAGWPTSHCLEDGNCDQAAVTSLRGRRGEKNPEIINWVLFDCPCDPGQGALLRDCPCVPGKFAESYVDVTARTLKSKPLRTVYVDDEIVSNQEIITRPPGTTVKLKIVSDTMPNGEKVKFTQKGVVDIYLEDEWEVEFTNGSTPEINLVAPAQGSRGNLYIGGSRVRPMVIALRGFATT